MQKNKKIFLFELPTLPTYLTSYTDYQIVVLCKQMIEMWASNYKVGKVTKFFHTMEKFFQAVERFFQAVACAEFYL